jgi:hypothetical protein
VSQRTSRTGTGAPTYTCPVPRLADKDDARLTVVPWTEELACRSLRLPAGLTHREKLAAFQDALADGNERLPDPAVRALIAAGYRELG